jgi:hypothetical protein
MVRVRSYNSVSFIRLNHMYVRTYCAVDIVDRIHTEVHGEVSINVEVGTELPKVKKVITRKRVIEDLTELRILRLGDVAYPRLKLFGGFLVGLREVVCEPTVQLLSWAFIVMMGVRVT